jgi:hypothetical protein
VDQLLQTTKMLYAKVAQALPVSGRQDLVRTFFFRRHYWRSLADLHAQAVAATGNAAQAVEENTQDAPYVTVAIGCSHDTSFDERMSRLASASWIYF